MAETYSLLVVLIYLVVGTAAIRALHVGSYTKEIGRQIYLGNRVRVDDLGNLVGDIVRLLFITLFRSREPGNDIYNNAAVSYKTGPTTTLERCLCSQQDIYGRRFCRCMFIINRHVIPLAGQLAIKKGIICVTYGI